MTLSPDDVQLIGRMLDERLDRIQVQARRRRRLFWLTMLLLTLGSTIASGFAVRRALRMFDDLRSEQAQAMDEAKAAYQAELAINREMQAQRAEAAKVSGYKPKQEQAQYEAGLIASMFKAMAQSSELQKQVDALDSNDPEALVAATEQMQATMIESLGAITRIMLRNTDPDLNTAQERLRAGADGSDPAVAPAPANPQPEAPASPQPAAAPPAP
ncbi:MAG: hypothetical protein H0W72_01400 [Planctomycetes bacterium]|nr:hypothetical protein [Planctomycetota bacterium]